MGLPAKGWPEGHWKQLIHALAETKSWNAVLIGAAGDVEKCVRLRAGAVGIGNVAGSLTLRQTFALAATTDRVVCHSSMLWHAAAAWKKPAIVVLGDCFPSAAAHHRQWGYPESVVLGPELGQLSRATVSEVLDHLRAEPRCSAVAA